MEISARRESQAEETASAKALGQNEIVCFKKKKKSQYSCSRERKGQNGSQDQGQVTLASESTSNFKYYEKEAYGGF